MSQVSCLDCYRKHIATAMVFEDEARPGMGYPLHKWFAIGELNAAEKEVLVDFPILSTITREHRLKYQESDTPIPSIELIQLACELEENQEKQQTPSINNIEEPEE